MAAENWRRIYGIVGPDNALKKLAAKRNRGMSLAKELFSQLPLLWVLPEVLPPVLVSWGHCDKSPHTLCLLKKIEI